MLEVGMELHLHVVHGALEVLHVSQQDVRLISNIAVDIFEVNVHRLLFDVPPKVRLHPGEELVMRRSELLLKFPHLLRNQHRLRTQGLLDVEHLCGLPVRPLYHLLLQRLELALHIAHPHREAAYGLLLLLLEVLDSVPKDRHLLGELPLERVEPGVLRAELDAHGLPVDLGCRLYFILDAVEFGIDVVRKHLNWLTDIMKQVVANARELSPSNTEYLLAQNGGLFLETLLADPEEVLKGHVANEAPLLVHARCECPRPRCVRPLRAGAVGMALRALQARVRGHRRRGALPGHSTWPRRVRPCDAVVFRRHWSCPGGPQCIKCYQFVLHPLVRGVHALSVFADLPTHTPA
mmetsp:Transcript_15971/g.48116  ORF Transcript_15971/g.48116 Transcript_15971/m.48116 type:complete len:350 (-) Transcript_15971:21-1070(-)